MYLRLKTISARRYAYLAEGERKGNRVRQKTVCYLGSLPAVAAGLSYGKRQKVESGIQRKLAWAAISDKVSRIPLTLDELDQIRRMRMVSAMKLRNARSRQTEKKSTRVIFPNEIFQQRAKGELAALTMLSKAGFEKTFLKTGDREYRMRV